MRGASARPSRAPWPAKSIPFCASGRRDAGRHVPYRRATDQSRHCEEDHVVCFPVFPIAHTLVTTLSMSVADRPSNPRARRLVRVSGAPFAHRRVYGFITTTHGKRVLRRIALGRGDVCGFTSAKVVVAPPRFQAGHYRLYVNAGKKLNKRSALWSSFQIYRRVL
jgi:hypothetical protein